MKNGYADVRQTSIQAMVLYFKTINKAATKQWAVGLIHEEFLSSKVQKDRIVYLKFTHAMLGEFSRLYLREFILQSLQMFKDRAISVRMKLAGLLQLFRMYIKDEDKQLEYFSAKSKK